MSDIVRQLYAVRLIEPVHPKLLRGAAAEIERLRADNERLRTYVEQVLNVLRAAIAKADGKTDA